jgi:hypothetical protein
MMLPIYHIKRIVPERWYPSFHFITRRLPRHWFYLTNDRRLWWLTGEEKAMQQRPRLVRYEIQEGCFLETYLNDRMDAEGNSYFGPVAGLVVHGSDILRFDCLENSRGHYHLASRYPHGVRKGLVGEIWLPETTLEEQVDRAIFELQRNSGHFLQMHPRRKVRNTRLDGERLAAVCAQLRAKMLEDIAQRSRQRAPQARASAIPLRR